MSDLPDELRVIEIGARAELHEKIENSRWCYRMWFMSAKYWWDDDNQCFREEDRPQFRDHAQLVEKEIT